MNPTFPWTLRIALLGLALMTGCARTTTTDAPLPQTVSVAAPVEVNPQQLQPFAASIVELVENVTSQVFVPTALQFVELSETHQAVLEQEWKKERIYANAERALRNRLTDAQLAEGLRRMNPKVLATLNEGLQAPARGRVPQQHEDEAEREAIIRRIVGHLSPGTVGPRLFEESMEVTVAVAQAAGVTEGVRERLLADRMGSVSHFIGMMREDLVPALADGFNAQPTSALREAADAMDSPEGSRLMKAVTESYVDAAVEARSTLQRRLK